MRLRNLASVFVLVFTLNLMMFAKISTSAQGSIPVHCGDAIEGSFREDRINHTYHVPIDSGDRLIVYTEVAQGFTDLAVDIGLWTPIGFEISSADARDAQPFQQIETGVLSDTGDYTIIVRSRTSTGGIYILHVGCVKADGSVISPGNFVTGIECGTIAPNSFSRDRVNHLYFVYLNSGDSLIVAAEVQRPNLTNLRVDLGLNALNGFVIDLLDARDAQQSQSLVTDPLPESGLYTLRVRSNTIDRGDYLLFVGCTLNDGTVINPGEASPDNSSNPILQATPNEMVAIRFGFPGLAPVDFSDGISIPFTTGAPNVGSIAPGFASVFGFDFEASAGDVFDMSFTRMSGNLNLGMAILSSNNQIVFQASLVTSETLLTRLTFPADDRYTIGVFRIDLLPPDTPEATAFQITGTLNP